MLVGDSLQPTVIDIRDGMIVSREPWHGQSADFEYPDQIVSPGFIDIQVNGFKGVDVALGTASELDSMSVALARTGVTSFVPTMTTSPIETYSAYCRNWNALLTQSWSGAIPLGLHWEGPFLSRTFRGTHPENLVTEIDLEVIHQWATCESLTYVTLAPELDHACEAIEILVRAGKRVCIGHSGATQQQTQAAVSAGATGVTHLYNAQPKPHHTSDSISGWALGDSELLLGLIADGVHVSEELIAHTFAIAGNRVCLVTDAISAAGMPDGQHRLGEHVDIAVVDGLARNQDGVLAGSTATLDLCIRQCLSVGVEVTTALLAATRNPASFLGLNNRGAIESGARADLVVLDDRALVHATMIAGAWVR